MRPSGLPDTAGLKPRAMLYVLRGEPQAAMNQRVADIGERALIERIHSRLPAPPSWVVIGIGDDAAVIEPERNLLEVVTTDALVEGVHFDRAFVSASDIGHKALAVNLSDLAAMGAAPRAAVLSLIVPGSMSVVDIDALVDSMSALARRSRLAIVGGNIAASPGPLIVDVTATGSVHRRRILSRSGARPGDDMYVSGSIGTAAAGLRRLRADNKSVAPESIRYLRPEPRTKLGMLLGRNRVSRACIDLSDGFAAAVRQIADASGVGAIIDADALPIEPKSVSLHEALEGGEDYELLFAVAPKHKRRLVALQRDLGEVPIRRVGRFTGDRVLSVELRGVREELPAGFQHFLQPQ